MVPESWDLVRYELRGLAPREAVKEGTCVRSTVPGVWLPRDSYQAGVRVPTGRAGWEGDPVKLYQVLVFQVGEDGIQVLVPGTAE